jgi:hypothetical protein
MICARLRYFLEYTGSIPCTQSDSRVGRSTQDVLLQFTNDIHTAIVAKEYTLAVLIDFKNAYDKVDHGILLERFKSMGIPPVFARWFRSFLADRRYSVRYGSATTGYVRFARGVPQGSVSGPLLYLIYTASLNEALDTVPNLKNGSFVDDVTAYSTAHTLAAVCSTVQSGLNVVREWAAESHMPFSPGKTEAIVFTLNKVAEGAVQLILDQPGAFIPVRKHVKLLGTMIDSKLSFQQHVAKLKSDTIPRIKQLAAICASSWGPNTIDMMAAYQSYIRSKYLYAAAVFGPFLSGKYMGVLEVMERKCLRIATGCAIATRNHDLHKEASLMPLQLAFDLTIAGAQERYARFPYLDPLNSISTRYITNIIRLKNHLSLPGTVRADAILRSAGLTPARLQEDGTIAPVHEHIEREPLLLYPKTPPHDTGHAHKVHFFLDLIEGCPPEAEDIDRRDRTKRTMAARALQFSGPQGFIMEAWATGIISPTCGAGAAALRAPNFEDRRRSSRDNTATRAYPGGSGCSDYRANGMGMVAACVLVEGLTTLAGPQLLGRSLLICGSSRELLVTLAAGPLAQRSVLHSDTWASLLRIIERTGLASIVIQWVPTLRSPDLDPRMAPSPLYTAARSCALSRLAEITPGKVGPTDLKSVKMLLRRHLHTPWVTSKDDSPRGPSGRDILTGGAVTNLRASAALPRADEVLLAQTRCCKSPFFGPLHFILKKLDARNCRWCHVAEESIPHLLQVCENPDVLRLRGTHLRRPPQGPLLAGLSHQEKCGVVSFLRALLDHL